MDKTGLLDTRAATASIGERRFAAEAWDAKGLAVPCYPGLTRRAAARPQAKNDSTIKYSISKPEAKPLALSGASPGHLKFDLDLPPLRGRFLIGGAEGMPLPTFN
jgi:hypothetical protein